MTPDDNVVETSDQDELEELAAASPSYWTTHTQARRIPTKRVVFPAKEHSEGGLGSCVRESSISVQENKQQDRKRGSPPRKRRKLDFDASNSSLVTRSEPVPSPVRSQPSSPTSYLTPSPVRSNGDDWRVDLAAEANDTRTRELTKGNGASFRVLSRQASTTSPSPSPDPLLLFTPPLQHNFQDAEPSPSSPASSPAIQTSPKTPVEDLSNPIHSPSPNHSPQPPREPSPATARAIEAAQTAEHSRRMLRPRTARQRNPYEHDRRMYKQQMRSNPDAIVKFVSPSRSRRRHSSAKLGEGSSGAEDEYQVDKDENMEDEETQAPRRWKGKERAMEEEPQPSWLPKIFDESFSTDEEDAKLSAEIKAKRKAERLEKKQRRKRPKPFPMDLAGAVSPASPARKPPSAERQAEPARPRPKPRPRKRTEEPTLLQAVEDEAPGPSWYRRRSVTFSSPVRRIDSSPLTDPGDGFMANGDDNYMYEDEFARGQSPLKLYLTPPDDSPGPSLGGLEYPPTSSDPNEVIDLTSDAESGDERSSSSSQSVPETIARKDRRKFKALERMMPKAMINKLVLEAQQKKAPSAERESARESGDEDMNKSDTDRPLRPGESRKRIRANRTLSGRSLEIRGDSESSDIEVPLSPGPAIDDGGGILDAIAQERDQSGSSSEGSVIEPIGHQPRPRYRPRSRGLVLDDGDDGDSSSSSSSGDDEDHGAEFSAPTKRRQRVQRDGEAEVDNSIDRMLARTDYTRPRGKRKRRRARGQGSGGGGGGHRGEGGGGGGGGGHGSRGAGGHRHSDGHRRSGGLRVTTAGAKRFGGGRQTLLPFKRLPASEGIDGEGDVEMLDAQPQPPHGNEVQFTGDEPARAKQKAAKLKGKTSGMYVFGGASTRLVGGRTKRTYVTIDEEVAAPRASVPRENGGTGPSRPTVNLHRSSPKGMRGGTLEQYWEPQDYEDDGFVVPDGPMYPHPASSRIASQLARDLEHLQRYPVTADMDVEPLPAGIAFPSTTYLGHGWLHELITLLSGAHHTIPSPPSCNMFDCYLHSDMTAADLSACLDSIADQLRNVVFGSTQPVDHELCHKWQTFLHSVAQHVTWLLANAPGDQHSTLFAEAESFARRLASIMSEPTEIIPEDEVPNPLVAQILWFLVEVSCRLGRDRRRRAEEPDRDLVAQTLDDLTSRLWDLTFGILAVPLELTRDAFTGRSIALQLAELWVCLINLASDATLTSSFSPKGSTFWSTYLRILEKKGLRGPQTDIKVREVMWKSIFTLCALSHFSIHGNSSMAPRLASSWTMIAAILERTPLVSHSTAEGPLSKRRIQMRDEYVRVLLCRCLRLNVKWHWRLDVADVGSMIDRFATVFKQRQFSNFAHEESDLPSFLRHNNIALLLEKKGSDTCYTLLLKLVVRAAEDSWSRDPHLARSKTIPGIVKKALSLVVPRGALSFTKDKPPSGQDLSMLYNRFSAIAVAVYLTPKDASYYLTSARNYVKFNDTDDETRRACIRGAMHLAILFRHLGLPLTGILEWLEKMTNTLIDEYESSEAAKVVATCPRVKNGTVMSIQLLLGCVRRILETSTMDPEQTSKRKYPDPALLQGSWVSRVFSSRPLTTATSTGDEIRRLVQAFLDARSQVIHKPPRPRVRVEAEDSQESQYDYGAFDLDLNDPVVLVALGDEVDPDYKDNQEKDKVVCEIVNKYITPAIYRLVCKHFNDPVYQQAKELSFQNADRWVDCWVGCASIEVQNGRRRWQDYLDYSSQSWEKIIETDWRRRIGLRFMFMILKLDPSAYLDYTGHFIEVMFESFATPNVTIEHDYVSLLFSINKLQHPLLHGLPIDPPGEDGDYHFTKHSFLEKRIVMLEAVFKNLSNSLVAEAHRDPGKNGNLETQDRSALTHSNQTHVTAVIGFLSAMNDICERYPPNSQARTSYVAFCKQISGLLSRYPSLDNHARLRELSTWVHDLT